MDDDDAAMKRRDLIIGVGTAITHDALSRILNGSAFEAVEFTRRAKTSSVGKDVLEHLELSVAKISVSYSSSPPDELFAVARSYRLKVDALINAPHTLAEGRRLYVYAAWLSETLAWTAHDLGDAVVADAYCRDAFAHAEEAGHVQLCAWALDARASIAFHDDRLHDALKAAQQGAQLPLDRHPLSVRLKAQEARAHAYLGHRRPFQEALDEASRRHDSLPSHSPKRFGKRTDKLAAYAMTSYPAASYLILEMFDEARECSEAALQEHATAHQRDRSPSREAIDQINLAHALAGLGDSRTSVRIATEALASSRIVGSVVARARQLAAFMNTRYPQRTETNELLSLVTQPSGA